jgi:hypothetical protein
MYNSTMNTAIKSIGDVEVSDRALTRKGRVFFEAPTDIAEVARMDDKIFVVLTVPDPEADKTFAGTNLWCIDIEGRLLWKAQNLNQYRTDPHNSNAHMYSDLCIFDRLAPKIACYIDDKGGVTLMADTGKYYNDPNPIDWSAGYDKAYDEFNARIVRRAKLVFIGAMKLRAVSKYVPLWPESKTPAMGHAQSTP